MPVLIISSLPRLPEGAPREAIDGFIQKGEPVGLLAGRIAAAIAAHPAKESAEFGQVPGALVGELKAKLRNRRHGPIG